MTASTARTDISSEQPLTARLQVLRVATAADMAQALEIRRRVFAQEQQVADLRVSDPDDSRSLIALARLHEWDGGHVTGRPVATGRLTPPLFSGDQAQIAWVATTPEARGQGIGTALMRFILDAADAAGTREVALAAQAHAEAFYRRLGFIPAGPLYDVRGIPHVRMVRRRPITH
jgi:predicted GNAT family N-acyltransferase